MPGLQQSHMGHRTNGQHENGPPSNTGQPNPAGGTAPDEPGKVPFALLLNKLNVTATMPVEVVPGHYLRKPVERELKHIRAALQYLAGHSFLPLQLFFESKYQGGAISAAFQQSDDPSDWRYWIISTPGGYSNDGLNRIERASRLTPVELHPRMYITAEGQVSMMGYIELDPFASVHRSHAPLDLSSEMIDVIRSIDEQIQSLSPDYEPVGRAISLYLQLAGVPRNQPLYALGLFAVMESILTHAPKGDFDTLTHQVETKMTLLNQRFRPSLDTSPFGRCEYGNLWKKLYGFRSAIAHGSQPNFAKDLKILIDHQTAARFVEDATKAVLRQALAEPRLILDLQRC